MIRWCALRDSCVLRAAEKFRIDRERRVCWKRHPSFEHASQKTSREAALPKELVLLPWLPKTSFTLGFVFCRMKAVGETPGYFCSYNTCQHRGRVFHVMQSGGTVSIVEVILGNEIGYRHLWTNAYGGSADDWRIACCSLGDFVLIMSGFDYNVFAFLVDVGAEPLSRSTFKMSKLTVSGDRSWPDRPYLCGTSESRAVLYFHDQKEMWQCSVEGLTLTMRKLPIQMPFRGGFGVVPLQLPDGNLLVAGSACRSRVITNIVVSEALDFENLGNMPCSPRTQVSLLLIKEQFVLGFGGASSLSDLWIFDLNSRRGSVIKQTGDWHPGGAFSPMAISDGQLYIIGGVCSKRVYRISLETLASLIQDVRISVAFCWCLRIPYHLESKYRLNKSLGTMVTSL